MWLGQEKDHQFFCEKHMISPLFLSRKFSKSTILKTPKIHSGFLRCAIQLFLTDNSDTFLRCVKTINTRERVSKQVCGTKKVTLLLLFWFFRKKKVFRNIKGSLILWGFFSVMPVSVVPGLFPKFLIFQSCLLNLTSKSDSDHNGNTNLKKSSAISWSSAKKCYIFIRNIQTSVSVFQIYPVFCESIAERMKQISEKTFRKQAYTHGLHFGYHVMGITPAHFIQRQTKKMWISQIK